MIIDAILQLPDEACGAIRVADRARLDIDNRSVPKTFCDTVLADLRRATRLIVKIQDEIDPQFRIASPEGDYWLAVTLPQESRERFIMLQRVSLFMAWKQATCFVQASEVAVSDCACALGVSHREVHACYAPISRTPRPWSARNFGCVEWIDRQQIGQEMIDLLPRGAVSIDRDKLVMLDTWFGPRGKFPAEHIPDGEQA